MDKLKLAIRSSLVMGSSPKSLYLNSRGKSLSTPSSAMWGIRESYPFNNQKNGAPFILPIASKLTSLLRTSTRKATKMPLMREARKVNCQDPYLISYTDQAYPPTLCSRPSVAPITTTLKVQVITLSYSDENSIIESFGLIESRPIHYKPNKEGQDLFEQSPEIGFEKKPPLEINENLSKISENDEETLKNPASLAKIESRH